jgi:hypothetical protein
MVRITDPDGIGIELAAAKAVPARFESGGFPKEYR